jgi:hypothetical protein
VKVTQAQNTLTVEELNANKVVQKIPPSELTDYVEPKPLAFPPPKKVHEPLQFNRPSNNHLTVKNLKPPGNQTKKVDNVSPVSKLIQLEESSKKLTIFVSSPVSIQNNNEITLNNNENIQHNDENKKQPEDLNKSPNLSLNSEIKPNNETQPIDAPKIQEISSHPNFEHCEQIINEIINSSHDYQNNNEPILNENIINQDNQSDSLDSLVQSYESSKTDSTTHDKIETNNFRQTQSIVNEIILEQEVETSEITPTPSPKGTSLEDLNQQSKVKAVQNENNAKNEEDVTPTISRSNTPIQLTPVVEIVAEQVIQPKSELSVKSRDIPIFKSEVEQTIEPIVKQLVEPIAKSVAEPIVRQEVEPVVEPVVKPVVEPESKPIAQPVFELAVESVAESVAEPVSQQVIEPVAQKVVEPVAQKVVEPVAQKVVEPIAQKGVEPVAESVLEAIAPYKPLAEKVADSVAKPTSEPIIQLKTEPVIVPVVEHKETEPIEIKVAVKAEFKVQHLVGTKTEPVNQHVIEPVSEIKAEKIIEPIVETIVENDTKKQTEVLLVENEQIIIQDSIETKESSEEAHIEPKRKSLKLKKDSVVTHIKEAIAEVKTAVETFIHTHTDSKKESENKKESKSPKLEHKSIAKSDDSNAAPFVESKSPKLEHKSIAKSDDSNAAPFVESKSPKLEHKSIAKSDDSNAAPFVESKSPKLEHKSIAKSDDSNAAPFVESKSPKLEHKSIAKSDDSNAAPFVESKSPKLEHKSIAKSDDSNAAPFVESKSPKLEHKSIAKSDDSSTPIAESKPDIIEAESKQIAETKPVEPTIQISEIKSESSKPLSNEIVVEKNNSFVEAFKNENPTLFHQTQNKIPISRSISKTNLIKQSNENISTLIQTTDSSLKSRSITPSETITSFDRKSKNLEISPPLFPITSPTIYKYSEAKNSRNEIAAAIFSPLKSTDNLSELAKKKLNQQTEALKGTSSSPVQTPTPSPLLNRKNSSNPVSIAISLAISPLASSSINGSPAVNRKSSKPIPRDDDPLKIISDVIASSRTITPAVSISSLSNEYLLTEKSFNQAYSNQKLKMAESIVEKKDKLEEDIQVFLKQDSNDQVKQDNSEQMLKNNENIKTETAKISTEQTQVSLNEDQTKTEETVNQNENITDFNKQSENQPKIEENNQIISQNDDLISNKALESTIITEENVSNNNNENIQENVKTEESVEITSEPIQVLLDENRTNKTENDSPIETDKQLEIETNESDQQENRQIEENSQIVTQTFNEQINIEDKNEALKQEYQEFLKKVEEERKFEEEIQRTTEKSDLEDIDEINNILDSLNALINENQEEVDTIVKSPSIPEVNDFQADFPITISIKKQETDILLNTDSSNQESEVKSSDLEEKTNILTSKENIIENEMSTLNTQPDSTFNVNKCDTENTEISYILNKKDELITETIVESNKETIGNLNIKNNINDSVKETLITNKNTNDKLPDETIKLNFFKKEKPFAPVKLDKVNYLESNFNPSINSSSLLENQQEYPRTRSEILRDQFFGINTAQKKQESTLNDQKGYLGVFTLNF